MTDVDMFADHKGKIKKLKKQIENCLVFDSSNKNDIVTEYFLKQKTTYEDQEKNIYVVQYTLAD